MINFFFSVPERFEKLSEMANQYDPRYYRSVLKLRDEYIPIYRDARAIFLTSEKVESLIKEPEDILAEEWHIDGVLNLPFQTTWIECAGDHNLFHFSNGKEEWGCVYLCAHEKSPGNYIFLTAIQNLKAATKESISQMNIQDAIAYASMEFLIIEKGDDSKFYELLFKCTNKVINSIQKSDVGTISYGGSVRIRTSKGKERKKIRNVVVCGKKKDIESVAREQFSKEVNWSHQWEVRGHWRRCDTIGKDREGKYCVEGFTWIKNHLKGEGTFIKKVRVFDKQEEAV